MTTPVQETDFVELNFHETAEGEIPSHRFGRKWLEEKIAPMPINVFLSEYTYYDTEYLLELRKREEEAN